MKTFRFQPPLLDPAADPNTSVTHGRVRPYPDQAEVHAAVRPKKFGPYQPAIANGRLVGIFLADSANAPTAVDSMPLWKRALDLAACAVALPFLALCSLVMALVTQCVSPGPVFFRQERIGHRGRRFKIYKFRTMRVNADCAVHQDYFKDLINSNAPMVKLDNRGDARLIPGAWFLRATGLDELPQIINVLRGEMSLVGPRPSIPAEYEQFTPWQRLRCDTPPGLTGLWQVSGKNRTTFEQMINLDVRYTREFSLWLDSKIILLTVPALLVQLQDTRRARKSAEKSPPRSYPQLVPIRISSDTRSS
jgi:lipopolysaccharide/colanic/teichoic acid biosynthesis glycosyltransferase